jgi:hypothetical protein
MTRAGPDTRIRRPTRRAGLPRAARPCTKRPNGSRPPKATQTSITAKSPTPLTHAHRRTRQHPAHGPAGSCLTPEMRPPRARRAGASVAPDDHHDEAAIDHRLQHPAAAMCRSSAIRALSLAARLRERLDLRARRSAADEEQERTVGLLLLGKGAVLAHGFDRSLAVEMDDKQPRRGGRPDRWE